METRRPVSRQLRLSPKSYSEMSSKLRRQGFERLKDKGLDTSEQVDLVLPSDFGAEGCDVFEKRAGNSVASFKFTEGEGSWTLDITFSKKMDCRSELLIQAFPDKEHSVHGNTYEARMVACDDELEMISNIDNLLVLLDNFEDDEDVRKTVNAQEVRKNVEKIAKMIPGNIMLNAFMRYVAGFFKYCEELWQGQIERLQLDPRIQQVMQNILDKA